MKKKLTVSFQGERGAFSHMAALKFFPKEKIDFSTHTTFEHVFKAVSHKRADFAFIPLENSLTGSIHENYDFLLKYNVPIYGELKLRIAHCLIAHKGVTIKKIKRIYSHPQALGQCKRYLKSLKKVEIIPSYDTAGSVKLIQEQKDYGDAAIAGKHAAREFSMHILKNGIEDNKHNFTRFLIIGKKYAGNIIHPKTSIVFSTKNIPGSLYRCLSVFALRDVDLIKIESRPIHGKPWNYMFYLDFSGTMHEDRCKKALGHLKEITQFIKILGTYPQGKEIFNPA